MSDSYYEANEPHVWNIIKTNSAIWLTGGFIDGKAENGPDGQYTFHFQLKPNEGGNKEEGIVYPYSMSIDLSDDLIEKAGEDWDMLAEWGIDFITEQFREALKASWEEAKA